MTHSSSVMIVNDIFSITSSYNTNTSITLRKNHSEFVISMTVRVEWVDTITSNTLWHIVRHLFPEQYLFSFVRAVITGSIDRISGICFWLYLWWWSADRYAHAILRDMFRVTDSILYAINALVPIIQSWSANR